MLSPSLIEFLLKIPDAVSNLDARDAVKTATIHELSKDLGCGAFAVG